MAEQTTTNAAEQERRVDVLGTAIVQLDTAHADLLGKRRR